MTDGRSAYRQSRMRMTLVPRDDAPRYSLVETDIRTKIAQGVLSVNDRLPNENELALQYQVSRSVIRHALLNLEQEGLVSRQRAKGTFITVPSLSLPIDKLSSFTDELEEYGIKASSVVLANELRPAPEAVATNLEIDLGTPTPFLERLRLGDDQSLCHDSTWIHPDLAASVEQVDLATDSLFDAYRRVGHRRVTSVDREVRARNASADIAAKLELEQDRAILEIIRIVRDELGRPLDTQARSYRADRFSLILDAPGAQPRPMHRLHWDQGLDDPVEP